MAMATVRAAAAALGVLAAGAAAGQTTGGQWPTYGGDLGHTRYAPLDQIDASNFASLEVAWRFGVANLGPTPETRFQSTPLVVDGMLYTTGGTRRAITALDAATGEQRWVYALDEGQRGEDAPRKLSGRGLAFWQRGDDKRVVYVTPGYQLVAVDATTGRPVESFGNKGVVDLWEGLDQGSDWDRTQIGTNSPPTIAGGVVIVGAAHTPFAPADQAENVIGYIRGYDVVTGRLLWTFHTIPRRGEPGYETWLEGSAEKGKGAGNAGVWATISADEELGLAYLPVESPYGDMYGGLRPGSNLYGESVVAVDLRTGVRRWHYQLSHHPLWDYDIPTAPILVDAVQNGRTVKALAQPTKQGLLFVLNRETGEPIWPIEEVPVPAGRVPGEWYSPTQPFPVRPAAPFARVEFVKERDLVRPEDTTPQHAAACEALWERSGGFYNAGPYTPFGFHRAGDPPRTTLQLPGAGGGVNWGGAAADPTRGIVYMHSHDTSLVGWIEQKRPGENYGRGTQGSTIPYDRGSVDGAGPYFSFTAPLTDDTGKVLTSLPCYRPPWSRLVALDAGTGETLWQTTLGTTPELPADRQLTGGSGSAGPTVTAGGLVFVGATADKRFRAFDARNGRELWSVQLPAQVNANPMSYLGNDGRQYVAAVVDDTLVAFALPRERQ